MTTLDFVAQPLARTTLAVIDEALARPGVETMDVAAAYITPSGLDELSKTMHKRGVEGPAVAKRWVTSFDYCRTHPEALVDLLGMPSSQVRVYDAKFCLAHHGNPRKPFHPKMFLFRDGRSDFALTGSGNLTRSGLRLGFEAGLAIRVENCAGQDQIADSAVLSSLRDYFEQVWRKATPLTQKLLRDYRRLYHSEDNRRNPTPTDEDTVLPRGPQGTLTGKELRKLRVCNSLWIDAGNITQNRGDKTPGNQLMMTRLSRVFFGFRPKTLPINSPIGQVIISYEGQKERCSMTYSDNMMDKLVLPKQRYDEPAAYDGECLLFERIANKDGFQLSIGSAADRAAWKMNSEQIEAAFKMRSVKMKKAREWGVF